MAYVVGYLLSPRWGRLGHGSTQEEALAHASEAIQLWIETARELGDPIPQLEARTAHAGLGTQRAGFDLLWGCASNLFLLAYTQTEEGRRDPALGGKKAGDIRFVDGFAIKLRKC